MKNSKLIIIGILGVLLFLFSSCQGELFLSSEEKIVGTWEFEQVKFKESGTLGKDDVTDEFKDIKFEFSEDNIISVTANNGTESSEGTWEIIQEDECPEKLEVLLGHYGGAVFETWEWELTRVSVNKIKGNERKDGGVYYYELVKIDGSIDTNN